MSEQKTENETAGGQSAFSGLVMHYREGHHNGWPTVMKGDAPVDDFVGELNMLANALREIKQWDIDNALKRGDGINYALPGNLRRLIQDALEA